MVKNRIPAPVGWAVGLFVLAFAVRLTLVVSMPTPEWVGEMQITAENLAQTGSLANPYGYATGPTAHVAPVYPAILALLSKLFGSWNVLPPKLFSIFSLSLIAALLPAAAKWFGLSPHAGLGAGLFFAAVPLFSIELKGTWEQPFAQLCLLLLFFVCGKAATTAWQGWNVIVLFGCMAGFVLLLAPSFLFLILLAPLHPLVTKQQQWRAMLPRWGLIGLIILLWLGPWTMRNYLSLGGFVPLRSNFGLELFIGNNPLADDSDNKQDVFNHPHPYVSGVERARIEELGELAYMREKQRLALEWITKHPAKFLGLTAYRICNFWFPHWSFCLISNPRIGKVMAAILSTLSILAFIALGRRWLLRDPMAWLWTVFMLAPTLIYTITHITNRYRVPIHAITVLLASDTVATWLSRLTEFNFRSPPTERSR